MRITPPFHPDCGRGFNLISQHWGEDRIVYAGDDGRLRTISMAFTHLAAADAFRLVADDRAAFRTIDLMALWELQDRLSARSESKLSAAP